MGEGQASIHTTCHAEASGDRRKYGDNSLQHKLPSFQFLHSIKLIWLIIWEPPTAGNFPKLKTKFFIFIFFLSDTSRMDIKPCLILNQILKNFPAKQAKTSAIEAAYVELYLPAVGGLTRGGRQKP